MGAASDPSDTTTDGGAGSPESGCTAALLVRDKKWLRLATLPFWVGTFLLVGGLATGADALWLLGSILGSAGLVAWILAWRGAPFQEQPGHVTVTSDEIRWNGARWLQRRRVTQAGWRSDLKHGHVVHLALGLGFEAKLAMPSATAARDLVERLGFGTARYAAKFVGLSKAYDMPQWKRGFVTVGAFVLPLAFVLVAWPSGDGPRDALALVVLIASVAALVAWHLLPTRIEVGADGIAASWAGRRAFIPFGEVGWAHALDEPQGSSTYAAVAIARTDGTTVRLLINDHLEGSARRDLLLARIQEALAAHGAGPERWDAHALARRDRPASAWIRDLRAVGSGADADHRRAPVPGARLWAVVEDASAEATTRAAAAVALASTASEDGRERIRIAARSTASPELREALARAADIEAETEADDAALASALEALERAGRRWT